MIIANGARQILVLDKHNYEQIKLCQVILLDERDMNFFFFTYLCVDTMSSK